MLESLLKFVRSENLFSEADELLLAVSGGIDSMVLATLLHEAQIPFAIAHVNYNLRGEQSVGDRDFVEGWANHNRVPIHIREVEAHEYRASESIQMIARDIRYSFFRDTMEQYGYTKLATAHHLDDSLETVLLNLTKGTGPRGLGGVPLINGSVVRPMMFASRSQIADYASKHGVKWREDPTNAKTDYQRNIIRNEINPILLEINPALQDTFRDTLERMNGMVHLLDSMKQAILGENLKLENGYLRLHTADWLEQNKYGLLLLSEIVSDYGINYRTASEIYGCLLGEKVGKVFESTSHRLNVDRGGILISEVDNKELKPVYIKESQTSALIGSCQLHFDVSLGSHFEINSKLAFLDYDSITWPLELRPWRQGDRFVPLGMKGKKMVSDFMIDIKIPVSLKKDVLILLNGGEIVWVVGYRISDKFKVSKGTKRTLKISTDNA
jgi:tRNA(Ile)-lysidine synthase